MKAKSLFWLLIVVALGVGLYVYAWPKFQSSTKDNKGLGPGQHSVVVYMPEPGP
jgi:hypothetical protein